jgi:hypothetical protein
LAAFIHASEFPDVPVKDASERARAINCWSSARIQREIKMRTFIFAIAAIVAATWAPDQAPAADRIPAFDIVRNCSAEVASAGIEKVADCAKDETDAKNELDKRWPQFGASNKQACVGESGIGGAQSYVELLTCLEMSSGEFLASRR